MKYLIIKEPEHTKILSLNYIHFDNEKELVYIDGVEFKYFTDSKLISDDEEYNKNFNARLYNDCRKYFFKLLTGESKIIDMTALVDIVYEMIIESEEDKYDESDI